MKDGNASESVHHPGILACAQDTEESLRAIDEHCILQYARARHDIVFFFRGTLTKILGGLLQLPALMRIRTMLALAVKNSSFARILEAWILEAQERIYTPAFIGHPVPIKC